MKTKREALNEGIDELRKRADLFAHAVAPLYAPLGWTWAGNPMPPSAEKILDALEELLEMFSAAVDKGDLDEEDEYLCRTGGLELGYAGRGQFVMAFRFEEWVELHEQALLNQEDD